MCGTYNVNGQSVGSNNLSPWLAGPEGLPPDIYAIGSVLYGCYSLTHSLTHSVPVWLAQRVSHLTSMPSASGQCCAPVPLLLTHSFTQSLIHSFHYSIHYSIHYSFHYSFHYSANHLCHEVSALQLHGCYSLTHSRTHSLSHSLIY